MRRGDGDMWAEHLGTQLFVWPLDAPPTAADVASLARVVESRAYDDVDIAVYHVSDGLPPSLGDDIASQRVGIIVASFHVRNGELPAAAAAAAR